MKMACGKLVCAAFTP
ncbi:hypothetical protein QO226_22125 [Vibrio vulnificus]|nr:MULTISPECIES: hypothetical protein [Vibrio]MCG6272210.1 hypothetical protein [Vibrio vulnificus]MCU8128959.1 hypothetical protein [Vibrio vulnificus]MCU8221438.1 hypothetical protein [Vibrio vulnificus]MCU8285094.1 hypothetical protein [Vibrio vulnificus]MCU8356873.1 hypothetical protein [Vibrio vulnificus]